MLLPPLYLDNIIFGLQKAGGISSYWFELLKGVVYKTNQLTFCGNTNIEKNIYWKELNKLTSRFSIIQELPTNIIRFTPFTKKIPEPSVFHSSYFRVSTSPKAANIVTVYDFTYEKYLFHVKRIPHYLQKKFSLKTADGIICISESTKSDMLKYFPFLSSKKIKVIPLGVSNSFYKTNKLSQVEHINEILNDKYILYVGSRAHYKNFDVAIRVLEELTEFKLVIIGGGNLTKSELLNLKNQIANRYYHLKDVDDYVLNLFYNNAFCLLYPSSYEGFGLPILEAMRSGCPVVSINSSSIPEVCGSSALLSDKVEKFSLLNEIDKLTDLNFRNHLILKGHKHAKNFSWDDCINQTLDFYHSIFNYKFG